MLGDGTPTNRYVAIFLRSNADSSRSCDNVLVEVCCTMWWYQTSKPRLIIKFRIACVSFQYKRLKTLHTFGVLILLFQYRALSAHSFNQLHITR